MTGDDDDNGSLRRCIVTGQRHDRDEMLRFVVSPAGEVVFDVNAKLPGRGLWLWPSSDMLQTATGKKDFVRAVKKAAKAEVKVTEGLASEVERQLKKRCLSSLSLAKRAGQVTSGFEKVRARLKKGNVGLLLEASDGATDGRNKIGLLARAASPDTSVVAIFGRDDLAGAVGRTEAVHMVIEPGRLAESMLKDAFKLARFTGQELNKGQDIVLNTGLNEEETDKT